MQLLKRINIFNNNHISHKTIGHKQISVFTLSCPKNSPQSTYRSKFHIDIEILNLTGLSKEKIKSYKIIKP